MFVAGLVDNKGDHKKEKRKLILGTYSSIIMGFRARTHRTPHNPPPLPNKTRIKRLCFALTPAPPPPPHKTRHHQNLLGTGRCSRGFVSNDPQNRWLPFGLPGEPPLGYSVGVFISMRMDKLHASVRIGGCQPVNQFHHPGPAWVVSVHRGVSHNEVFSWFFFVKHFKRGSVV